MSCRHVLPTDRTTHIVGRVDGDPDTAIETVVSQIDSLRDLVKYHQTDTDLEGYFRNKFKAILAARVLDDGKTFFPFHALTEEGRKVLNYTGQITKASFEDVFVTGWALWGLR